ncbi:DUF481 domain-containing protein [Kiritimatiellaeota bacterium B1221]|nr:DUF481 domain-containing protein [Kiritimatiellaeota bacterium B1221]
MRNFFILLLSLQLSALFVNAQETEGFETDINFGFTLTDGNSDTSLLKAGVESKNIREKQETLLSASYEYGRTKDKLANGEEVETTNLDRGKAVGQSNWLFSEEAYAFYNFTAETDELAKIDYRINNGPGVGYYFLRDDGRLLNTETSVVYVMEDVGGNSDDYAAFRLAQKFEYKFAENGARVWQTLEGVMNFSDTDNYFMELEVGVEAKLHANLSLRVVLKDKYDNDPEPDVEKNDLTLFSGISVKL